MKKYSFLLFDLDDTLLNFGAAESFALRSLFEDHQIPLTAGMEAHYKKINQGLWKSFELGKIDIDEVLNTRFTLLFKEYGQEVDGAPLEMKFRSYLDEGHELIDGAIEMMTELKNKYDLYIATNGISKTQDKRLRDSGLFPLVKDVFTSEDVGFQKPMNEYFDYVFKRIPNFSVEKGLMIGDSLSSDIKGGQLAGLDTCWYNPEKKPNDTEIVPTYEIQRLDELYRILNLGLSEQSHTSR